LTAAPGINVVAAQHLIAEIGPEVPAFPSAGQLASWVGVCPGRQDEAPPARVPPAWHRTGLEAHARTINGLVVIFESVPFAGRRFHHRVVNESAISGGLVLEVQIHASETAGASWRSELIDGGFTAPADLRGLSRVIDSSGVPLATRS